jgi:hypothetical protein
MATLSRLNGILVGMHFWDTTGSVIDRFNPTPPQEYNSWVFMHIP